MTDPPSDRNRLLAAQDHLIELFIQHDEASRAGDRRRVEELNLQIDKLGCTTTLCVARSKRSQ